MPAQSLPRISRLDLRRHKNDEDWNWPEFPFSVSYFIRTGKRLDWDLVADRMVAAARGFREMKKASLTASLPQEIRISRWQRFLSYFGFRQWPSN